jgi:hypothetical protein
MEKKNGNDKPRRLQLQLPVSLSQAELLERHRALTKCLDEWDKIEANWTLAKAAAKAAKEPVKQRMDELRMQIREKAENRLVECEQRMDYKRNAVEVTRLDTGEVVVDRAMEDAERQGELSVELPPAPDVPKE